VPKKWSTRQTRIKKIDEGEDKIGTQKGTKNTTHLAQVQQKQAKATHVTTTNPNSQELGGNKRPTT
jgi:hypothetical protein